MPGKQLKPKKCRTCKTEYNPYTSTQTACSPKCALEQAKEKREKKERKEIRKRKQELKTKSQLMKEAQVEFNKYIRLRDKDLPCISCGRFHTGQYHAGHYLTTGSHPELRYHEANCHKQCAPCNNHLSGNIAEYRPNLLAKVGQAFVDWLEGSHKPQNWTREDLIEIKLYYRQKTKELSNE